jgi:hypothetical protein
VCRGARAFLFLIRRSKSEGVGLVWGGERREVDYCGTHMATSFSLLRVIANPQAMCGAHEGERVSLHRFL